MGGDKGCNVFHIQDETNCKFQLHGKKGEDSLDVEISGGDWASVKKATGMAQDLIATVLEECGGTQRGGGKGGKGGKRDDRDREGGKGKGKDKGKVLGDGETEERVPVPTAGVDEEVGLRG